MKRLTTLMVVLLACGPASFGISPAIESLLSYEERQTPAVESSPSQLDKARQYLDAGHLEEALSAVQVQLKQQPDSAEAHFLKGLILFRQQKASESLAAFTEGAKHHDPSAFDLKIVALDYVLLGDYASADHWLTRSVEFNPKDAQAWYYLGRTKYTENRFEEAVSAFRECLKLDPKNVKAEDNLGLSFQGLGKTADARAAFENAIAWQKQTLEKNAGPFLNMGILLLEENKVEEAMPYLQQATEIAPDDSRTHEHLAKAYSRLERFEKAQTELERAVTLNPESSSLHFMLGQLYRKRGMMERAKAELDKGAALKDTERKKPMSLE